MDVLLEVELNGGLLNGKAEGLLPNAVPVQEVDTVPKAEPKELYEGTDGKPLLVAVLPNENPWLVGAALFGAAPNVPNEKTDEPVEVALDEEPVGAKVDVRS